MIFEYSEPQTEFERLVGGYFNINMLGRINEGDDERLRKFLESTAPPPRTGVYINSGGGHVEAAIGIGRLVRDAWFSTSIGTYELNPQQPNEPIIPRQFTPAKCISAATLIFIGGRLRYHHKGSLFGVHQFSFKNPTPDSIIHSQRLSAKIASYVIDMGILAEFLEISADTPGDQISYVDEEKLRGLNVITGGMTEATWGVEIQPEAIWVRGERDSHWGHGKVFLIYSKSDGFAFGALVETMGRQNELMTFGLVEIVVNGEDIRIDISDRCGRDPSGIYTFFHARLSECEAQLLSHSLSFGIQIRATAQAPVFLGIAALSTKGGEQKLQGLYKMAAT
jgi:hypothetical protein